jgi:hypothetical protein
MRWWTALGVAVLFASVPGPARAEGSPKRPVPDYDGRGPPPATPGEAALWVPRVLLSPFYFVSEYVVRRPLGVAIPEAERVDLPRKIYDFLTFGPEHKAGIAPVAFVEFNFNPSLGVYAFWDDAGFEGHDLRLHTEAWPDAWLGGSLTDRIVLDRSRTLQLRVAGIRRPDQVFYGTGPSSLQSSQSRYGVQRVDAGATYDWRFWRSSRITTAVGVRDVDLYDGGYGGDPSLAQEAATGAFPVPYGFGREYTAVYSRVVAALGTRDPPKGDLSGVRLELAAEQGSDMRASPPSGWIRYGATAEGYVDVTGHGRVVSLSATALFADPLGSAPVPFTELVYLGGDHPMPGYFSGRLVDRSAAAATLRYAWPVGPWLDGNVQVAVGNVFGTHLAQFDPGLLRFSAAVGLAVAGLVDAPIELLVGCGSETFDHGAQVDSLRVMLGVPHTF